MTRTHRIVRSGCFAAVALSLITLSAATPTENWPGFRGPNANGVADAPDVPLTWSKTDNVTWSIDIPGRGWSSPIIWNNVVYLTSAISGKLFKQPSPGLYGNDYIAELRAQGVSAAETSRLVRARDNELPEESDEIRYMVYAYNTQTGAMLWEREAHKGLPFGGRHRKNTYSSETPFTDGERLYVSFGQNLGVFCYSLDGTLLWKKQWPPQPIYLDFGTASSPVVHSGKVFLLQDSEKESFLTALDAKTGEELWRTARSSRGLLHSSWNTPYIWQHDQRTEVVTTGHGSVRSYDLDGQELWRITTPGTTMPTPSAFAANGMLFVGTGAQGGDASRPVYAVKPGATGDISLSGDATSNEFIAWSHPRASGYTPSPIFHSGRMHLVHDTGIMAVLDAETGEELYKARVGGVGHTFSASPIAIGNRLLFLDEEGTTVVVEPGAEYKEIGQNVLDEMSLASPAVAGNAIYIRTETKLYRIG
ncbi:MAG: PQQ-binding-like beta-propeller repeat protein [Acidobacteria bacterium]|jgi:outer membrane protein assembly factor BamB|nr:PQQ-binding-like beta-propeller repeat protein [Acidobacteriota bacterium]